MKHVVLNSVELDFLNYSLAVLTIEVDVYQIDFGSVNYLVDLLFVNEEVDSFGSTVCILLFTVDYAGNETLLTNFLGSLLTEVGTLSTSNRD